MTGEQLYEGLKLNKIQKTQLNKQQLGDVYKYMIDSEKVKIDQFKPTVIKEYNLDGQKGKQQTPVFQDTSIQQIQPITSTYTPSRSPDTNAPISPMYTPSRSPDANIPSTNPEMALVDVISNITMPQRGRETQHERQQGSAYTPKPIEQPNISRNLNAVNANEREKPQVTWSQNPIQAAAENVRAGWNQFGRTLPSTLDMVLGDKGIPLVDNFVADQRRQHQEEAEKLSKINSSPTGSFAGSVFQGIGQSIPSVATSLMAAPFALTASGSMLAKGGTQLINNAAQLANPTLLITAQQSIKQLMENPNTYMSVLRGVGSQYEEAVKDGATKEQAVQSAITGGIPSGLIEALGGPENLTNALASKAPFGRVVLESGLGEMFEEILQYPVENIAQKFAYNKDMPYYSTTEQAVINPIEQAYAGASAFVSSALMGGAGSAVNTAFDKLGSRQKDVALIIGEELDKTYKNIEDGTQATEQDLDNIIVLLKGLEETNPELKEYLQGHVKIVDDLKMKVAEDYVSRQTKDINQVEQTLEQDTSVPQIEDKGVTEDINTLIKQGSYEYKGLPVRYSSKLKGEARNYATYIEVGDKFFNLDKDQQINVLNHEVAHNNNLFEGNRFTEVMDGGIFGKTVTGRNGKITWEGIFGDVGTNAVEETYTEALKVFRNNPEWLKANHPKVYEYFTGERITEDIKPIDNIIPIESLKPQELLQDSNENVTETQQTENVGYHAGDLGKSEHFGRQYGSSRGTGHFGTGTYFVGNQKNIDLGGYKDRPIHKINFDGYNLYKPTKESQARKLHDFLKYINTYYETSKRELLNKEYEDIMEEMHYDTVDDVIRDLGNGTTEDVINQLRILGLDEAAFEENEGMTVKQYADEYGDSYDKKHELNNYINNAKNGVVSTQRAIDYKSDFDDNVTELFGISKEEAARITDDIYNDVHEQAGDRPLYGNAELDKTDSASTRFMKKLGYEGVDVRHLPSFDDTEYGSVIYDLKTNDTLQATTEPTANETIPTEQIVEEDKETTKTKYTTTEETAIDNFANKLFNSHLLERQIDRNTLTEKQINEAVENNKVIARELIDAIHNKDFDFLTGRLHRGNILSLKLFTEVTGLPTNTQKITDANIRSLDPEAYHEWTKKQSEIRKQAEEQKEIEKQKAKDEEKQEKLKEIENIKISYNNEMLTLKEYAEKLKAEGYRYVESNNYGGFELRNDNKRYFDGKDYKNKDVRQYLRNYFRNLAKTEQEAEIRQEQEEYEALSKEDKEAIEGLFTKKTKEADKISDTNTEKEGIIETKGDVENGENEISIDEDRIDVPEPSGNIPTEEVQTTTGQQGVGETSLPETGGTEGVRSTTDGTGNDLRTELGNDNARDTDNTAGEGTREQSTKDKPKDVSVTSNPKGNDYVINSQEDVVTDTDKKTRYQNNVDAINLMKQIQSENRYATPEEQKILAKYAGWGGISEAFATDSRYDWDKKEYVSNPKKGWEKEHKELKEILTEEEYKRANNTVTDAFYTPISVIQSIYEGLKHFGFEGGRVIEPAFGIGNFIGTMPTDIRNNSKIITGIELDNITGNIAKLLYPNSDIRVQGFEKAKLPDRYYDVAISNVPFGQTNINDTRYSSSITKSIHNYFFARALDVVRPGGIVMFITSSKTMDSKDTSGIRAYIKGKADLIGAVRLPNTTFKDSSLTEVVSDLIILKVREPGTTYNGESFSEMKDFKVTQNGYTQQAPMNEYYLKHPEHLLGEPVYGWDNTSRGNVISVKGDGRDLGQSIKDALLKMQGNIYEESDAKIEIRERTEKTIKEAAKNTKEGSYEVVNGKLTINKEGKLVEVDKEINKTELDKVAKLIDIKNTARDLLNAQRDNESSLKIDTLRKKLNRTYDSYVKKNGFLNNKKNVKLLYDDPDVSFLLSLEEYTKPKKADKNLGYAAVKESAIKSDIFTKDTIATIKKITKADSAKEALVVSLNEKGQVDVNYISNLTGKTEKEITKELAGHIYKNPITQKYETSDMYLSGNVKYKLKEAEARAIHEPEYNVNVEALKAVQPKDKESWEISIKVGSSLVSADVYEDFTKHLLGRFSDIEVYQTQHSGEWHVRERDSVRGGDSVKKSIENRSKWGIDVTGFTAINLLEKIMNNKSIIVNRTVKNSDGSTTKVNMPEETALAQEKAELIKAEFDKWLQEHGKGETLKNVTQYYNDTFNTDVLREFDGSHLSDTLENMNSSIKLTKHQKDAVWRIISGGGNSLLAHEVGAGKTFSMIAASMEMKRLGIIKKPMFVVPNNIYEQWGIEFRRLYPGSKILIPDASDFSKKNRHILLNKIATGTYDAVIVPESQFTMITASEEYTQQFFDEKLQELEQALEIAKAEGQKLSESKIRQKIKNFETKLEKKLDSINKDKGVVVFEELGIDSLFVDEAHRFKNLMYQTGLQVSGLGTPDGSEKSFDLLMKVRYLQKLNGGKGITFATATPILNSLTEVYNWQQYLAPDQLKAKNIYSFDAWASIFAKIESVAEVKPEGTGYRVKNGISKITNVGMLAKMFREFTDFKTQEMLNLPRPSVKTGKYITISVPKTAWLENYMAELAQRAEAVRKGQVKPEVDNMLKITSDGRKAALDPRLVDPLFQKGEGEATKIDIAVDHLFEQWSKTKKDRLTHLVFVEFSTPKGKDTKKVDNEFDVDDDIETDVGLDSFYSDIKRKLVAKGIPEKEIAFIHDAKNADQKIALKNRFNSGEIRILIGNNEKMGVGIDLQKRTKTITHIDYPWRPKDLQQEDGRGLRQGNMNKEMELYVIVSEGSFDARLWDNLQRKSKLVDDMLTADLDAVEIEDVGVQTLSAQEVVGIASGNPLMQEQIIVSQKANKLRSLEKGFKKEKVQNQKRLAMLETQLVEHSKDLEAMKEVNDNIKDTFDKNFKITIDGKEFKAEKEADKFIAKFKTDNRQRIREEMKLTLDVDFAGVIKSVEFTPIFDSGKEQFVIRTRFIANDSVSFFASEIYMLQAKLDNLNKDIKQESEAISKNEEILKTLKEEISKEFMYSKELREATLREQELMRILNPEQVLSEDAVEDDVKEPKTRASKGGESFTGTSSKPLIDMSRKLKKPTEIRNDITKKFGVPNSTKKFNRSKKFLGYYKVMPEVIRLRYDNDIGTVMHELGHHFDKKYNFNGINKQLITDMINKMNPTFKKNYQKSELPGEAIAEFLRYYTTDSTTAKEFAGDFYDLFEQTLSKEDLKNIQEVRSDVLRWVNAERSEKRKSTTVPLSQKKKIGERISDAINFEKGNAVLFDRYAPIQQFAKTVEKLTGRKLPPSLNPYMLVERTYKNNSTIEGIIKGQLRDTKFNPLKTEDSLQKIVDDVKRDVADFEDYLKLKHAITLAEKDHMIYNTEIYNNVEDMQQDLEFIEEQYPEFIELSERLYKWYDMFFKAWVVDTNMLGEDSKKVYDKMRKEYPYYVPMFRVREDGSIKQASSSLTDQKAPVDRLSEKGSDRDTISPIDNIVTQVSRMVNAYSKNNVMRAIVENYNTVDGLGGFIDRVPPDMEKQILSTQAIKNNLETDFKDIKNIDDIINSIPDLIENYRPLTKSKDKEIVGVITEGGKKQFYQVFDKAFLNSLTNMNPTQLDATVRMIANVRRTTTGLTTGLNPIFGIVSNAPRDFTQAYVFGSYKNPAEYVYQYAKALTGVVRKNSNYKTFRDIGGVYGSSMTTELRTKNDFIRRLTKYRKGQKVGAKNALSYIGELILDFNDAIETAPRLAEFNKAYKIAKKRGDSDYDATLYALSRADDVTLNFSRRGEIMNTAVGQSIPYLNAGLQGMDKLRRGLFTGEERIQTLIKSITMLTIPTILLWLAHRDDEDYEKLTKGIKDNYWILWKNPDGSFVRIPKPKDLAAIFGSSFERSLNAYFKEEGAGAFEGWQSTLLDSLLPPVDTIFRPLIDVKGNKKWSGGKIVPMAMDYLPKTEQYDETTSKIGVELAQLIGKIAPDSNFASPKNVDYVLDQYYGGLADILLPIATPTSYVDVGTLRDKYNYLAMPMAALMKVGDTIGRKFKADPSYSNDVVNDFYDLRDKTTKANNAYEKRGVMSNDVDLISENQFKAYYKSISSMWKTIDYIDSFANKPLPDEYKEGFKKLINQSRFADSEKQKVINDMKDGKLNRESVTMLQKTVRDEIVKLADKAVKEYKANHKENNELLR